MAKIQPVYTDTFKEQLVALHHSGKSLLQLSREYGPSPSTISKWVKYAGQSGSFKEADNRSPQEKELIELRKRNRELEIPRGHLVENDLLMAQRHLDQAALNLERK